jgi:hypothetical protein
MLAGMAAPAPADTLHKPTCSGILCWAANKNNSYTLPDTAQVDVVSANQSLDVTFVALIYQIDENGDWFLAGKSIGAPQPLAEGDFASGFMLTYGRRALWSSPGVACGNAVWLVWAINTDGSLALTPQSSNFC